MQLSYFGTTFNQVLETIDEIFGFYVILFKLLAEFVSGIDNLLDVYKPSILISILILTFLLYKFVIKNLVPFCNAISVGNVVKFARAMPFIKGYVDSQIQTIKSSIDKDMMKPFNDNPFITNLAERPLSPDILKTKLKVYVSFNSDSYSGNRISGALYKEKNDTYNNTLMHVYGETMWSNPLHADVFAGIRKMEAEIVRMVSSMYKNDNPVGSVTSGGTESIVMACKAYRDYALSSKSFNTNERPQFVVPRTAHAAFEKAARFLNCDIVFIPNNPKTMKVDVKAMESQITSRTCMLVGSAPNFPHGIIDPIEKIAALGMKYNIPVHVDACLGGFLLPFLEDAGFSVDEKFDFSVEGVTSVSVDPHKYGYSPKGVSVLLYSDKKYLHCQYSIQTDWPGGVYASPSLPGSRPGGLIATCWAAMLLHGRLGYVKATATVMKVARRIKKELGSGNVPGLQVIGDPFVSVIAFKSDKFNILMLNDKLKDLGWNLNVLQFPPSFHICVTLRHCVGSTEDNFIKEVKDCSKELLATSTAKPAKNSSAAIYGMCQTLPDRSLVSDVCKMHLDASIGL